MSDPVLELLAAPPNPAMSVDEHAVYAGGRRRLRRRALRRTAVGVVGVVGVAAIAFGALGAGVDRETLPAGPPPTTSSTGNTDSSRSTSAELFDGRYSVEVMEGTSRIPAAVILSKLEDGKWFQFARSSASTKVVSLTSGTVTGTWAEGVMLGTAPADMATSLTIAPGAKGEVQHDMALLPGTDYQAIAIRFDNPADVATYEGTIWMDDQGSGDVRDALGNRLPSTKLAGTDPFFVDHRTNVMGAFTNDGGWTRPLTEGRSTTSGYGKQDKGGLWSWRSVTLLPAGARDIDFTWSGDEYHSEVFVEELPGGQEVVAFADGSAVGTSTGPIVTKVAWTDKAGTRHTDAVE